MESVMTNISASDLKRVLSTVGNRRDLKIPAINPPTIVVLDTPNSIHASPPSILTASHIQPGNSTAQIHHDANDDGGDSTEAIVAFSFWWENSSLNPVLLTNIASHLTINGAWQVDAGCDVLFPHLNYAAIDSIVTIRIVEFWNQPPSSPPNEYGQQQARVVDLDVEGGLCLTDSPQTTKREWVFNKNYNVKYSSLEVPSKGLVLFEMRLYTFTRFGGGPCFASVNSSIVCPALQFNSTEVIQKGPPLP
jgi:hypothetical protein